MKNEIVEFCINEGILIDSETYNFLLDFNEDTAKKLIKKISSLDERIISKSVIVKHAKKIQELVKDEKIIEKFRIELGISFEISREKNLKDKGNLPEIKKASELKEGNKEPSANNEKSLENNPSNPQISNNFKILKTYKKKLNKSEEEKITVDYFTKYFKRRFSKLKRNLQNRPELDKLSSVNKLAEKRQAVSIIGVVYSKRTTKNNNLLLDIEDLTGKVRVLINKDKEKLYEIGKGILVDDVVGVRGYGDRNIIFANKVVYPEPILKRKNLLEEDKSVAFISDIHLGSDNFLEKNFETFIKWINGNYGDEKQKEEAKKIKYLLITGDSVDGVGVFPGQEDLLNILDIRNQYKKLASYLSKIRKDVRIIMCPGQHDASRVAEPQPPINKDYAEPLYELENVFLVSNPTMIELIDKSGNGVKVLMYHGASMSAYVNEIEELRVNKGHDHPNDVVKELLKRRHLASLHSLVTYIPTRNEDYLLIDQIPDIINTADFHRPAIDNYNGIKIICNSCWQSRTAFEEKVGNNPDPCKVPIFNLKTGDTRMIDFSDNSCK